MGTRDHALPKPGAQRSRGLHAAGAGPCTRARVCTRASRGPVSVRVCARVRVGARRAFACVHDCELGHGRPDGELERMCTRVSRGTASVCKRVSRGPASVCARVCTCVRRGTANWKRPSGPRYSRFGIRVSDALTSVTQLCHTHISQSTETGHRGSPCPRCHGVRRRLAVGLSETVAIDPGMPQLNRKLAQTKPCPRAHEERQVGGPLGWKLDRSTSAPHPQDALRLRPHGSSCLSPVTNGYR